MSELFPQCEIVPQPDSQFSFRIQGQERMRWHFGSHYSRPFFYPLTGPAGIPPSPLPRRGLRRRWHADRADGTAGAGRVDAGENPSRQRAAHGVWPGSFGDHAVQGACFGKQRLSVRVVTHQVLCGVRCVLRPPFEL